MTTEITLAEAQKWVGELEQQIEHAVQEFHNNTRLSVTSIDLNWSDISELQHERPRYGYSVKVEVKI